MTESTRRNPEPPRDRDRIVNFSDGVFAIVITLLILTIEVPDIPPASVAQELPSRLLALEPDCLSYVISFLMVAVYWQAHHRVFGPIRGYDRTLLWLNFLFLMTISFLPFPTSLLGEYREQLPVVIYAINVSLASLLLVLTSWYATIGHRLTDPRLDEGAMRRQHLEGLAVLVEFLLSIAISFFSVTAAMLSWLLLVAKPLIQRVWPR
jgi:TMEM175 potassium channel family protein